jgi:hypothetical protein
VAAGTTVRRVPAGSSRWCHKGAVRLLIAISLAVAACGGSGECASGIRVTTLFPCCNAQSALLLVTYPDGFSEGNDIDTSDVAEGGYVTTVIDLPDNVTAGNATVQVDADSPGIEHFRAVDSVDIAPGTSSDLTLHLGSLGLDAGL